MQKKLIALAIAGLASGAAFAQTNVTIYGVADAAYVYGQGDTPSGVSGNYKFSGIQSGYLSGSRLGFKGEEALGNGLKAIFTLEYSLSIDGNNGVGNNTSGLQARQQFVGLQSDKLGTATLGRQYAPGYLATVNNDPTGGATFGTQSILSNAGGNTITPNSAARWNNSMAYATPNFSGFTGKLIYGFGESGPQASTSDNGQFGVGGNYSNGPLNVDLVYQTRQNVNGQFNLPGMGNDINEYYVGAAYDFKAVKIMGSWQQQNDKNSTDLDNSVWAIGASIPVMAASNIILSYGQLMWDSNLRDLAGQKTLNESTDSATLGWTTNLSKRTTLYAGYVWVQNDNRSSNVGLNSIGARGETNNTFLSGIRHTF